MSTDHHVCYIPAMARPSLTKPKTLRHARTLRHDSTDAEKKLWAALRARRLAAVKFRRQAPIGPFIADFCADECKLVIELDGGQHADAIRYDEKRSARMAARGYRVLRFWNNEVLENIDGVLSVILAELGQGEKD